MLTMRAMQTKSAIEFFGGVPALAAALNIRPQAIYQWGSDVPAARAFQLEVLSGGKLKVGSVSPGGSALGDPQEKAA